MRSVKPEARKSESGLSQETNDTVKPDAKSGEHGIVLDDKAQEQPKDRQRAQDDSTQADKPKT